jgi:hypothetical protein
MRDTINKCIYRYVNLLYYKYYMFRPPVFAIFREEVLKDVLHRASTNLQI